MPKASPINVLPNTPHSKTSQAVNQKPQDSATFTTITKDDLIKHARMVGETMTGFNPHTATLEEAKRVGLKTGDASKQFGIKLEKYAQAKKLTPEQQTKLLDELQKVIFDATVQSMALKKR